MKNYFLTQDNQKYVNKARKYVLANIKALPLRNHWSEVAGVLNTYLLKKDMEIENLKRELALKDISNRMK